MNDGLEDARKLAHGTYDDVIVVEHRRPSGTASAGAHVVLEMPERSRVIDRASQYDIDGVLGPVPPAVGGSYRVIIAPASGVSATSAVASSSLRYETMNR